MRSRGEPEWAEFNDVELVDWRRARALIEHENELTNHRQTWLMNSQGFLFAWYALVLSAVTKNDVQEAFQFILPLVLAGIAVIGMIISRFIRHSLLGAQKQHDRTVAWWRLRHGNRDPMHRRHPPITGELVNPFPPNRMATIFFWIWVVFGGVSLSLLNFPLKQLLAPSATPARPTGTTLPMTTTTTTTTTTAMPLPLAGG